MRRDLFALYQLVKTSEDVPPDEHDDPFAVHAVIITYCFSLVIVIFTTIMLIKGWRCGIAKPTKFVYSMLTLFLISNMAAIIDIAVFPTVFEHHERFMYKLLVIISELLMDTTSMVGQWMFAYKTWLLSLQLMFLLMDRKAQDRFLKTK